jgi:hypothetical protein
MNEVLFDATSDGRRRPASGMSAHLWRELPKFFREYLGEPRDTLVTTMVRAAPGPSKEHRLARAFASREALLRPRKRSAP